MNWNFSTAANVGKWKLYYNFYFFNSAKKKWTHAVTNMSIKKSWKQKKTENKYSNTNTENRIHLIEEYPDMPVLCFKWNRKEMGLIVGELMWRFKISFICFHMY